MAQNVNLNFGSLPGGTAYCPPDFNTLAALIIAATTGTVEGSSDQIVISPTVPTVDETAKPWLKWDATGDVVYFPTLYFYIGTLDKWCARHPIPPGSGYRQIYVGTAASIETYDGGSAGAVSDAAGPMWEIDTDFEARFPVGVGTFAASGGLDVGDTQTDTGVVGVDQHALITDELAAHRHYEFADENNTETDAVTASEAPSRMADAIGGNRQYQIIGKAPATLDSTVGLSSEVGEGDPHNNLPPFKAVYFLKRTNRLYYVGGTGTS